MQIHGFIDFLALSPFFHGGTPHSAGDVWGFWSLDPWIIGGLVLAAGLYARGWRSLARRGGLPGPDLKRRAWLFAGGIATLVTALVSPVDGMAEELFSVHMVQHNLLMLVAAPLLVLSIPLPAVLLGLPGGARRAVGRGWQQAAWLRSLWHLMRMPMTAWLLQAIFLWVWHSPVLYQAALERDGLHALEHFTFLGSALLFWWVALDILGSRQQRGAGILYLFTTAMQGGLLGALLTFSPRVWYPIYTERAAEWGLSALADQQLAGTIMWVPTGMVYLLAALLLLKSWMDDMEAKDPNEGAAGQGQPMARRASIMEEKERA